MRLVYVLYIEYVFVFHPVHPIYMNANGSNNVILVRSSAVTTLLVLYASHLLYSAALYLCALKYQ